MPLELRKMNIWVLWLFQPVFPDTIAMDECGLDSRLGDKP